MLAVLGGCVQESADLNDTIDLQLLRVHFIDVGQGDAILVQTPAQETMLIDAGGNAAADKVVSYLEAQGVSKIDVLVATHPHEDHIGGMDVVINYFDIREIYMPKVSHNTATYEDVLEAVKGKGLKIKTAKTGVDIPMEQLDVQVLAPDESMESSELNDYSVVIRLSYENTTFLFQGDAEKKTEEQILEDGSDIKADVIKIGHHGSSSSSTRPYIEAVNPSYAVIMLGKDNRYGHPHQETMELLEEMNVPVYRTDQCGSILATSDGRKVSFVGEAGTYSYNE